MHCRRVAGTLRILNRPHSPSGQRNTVRHGETTRVEGNWIPHSALQSAVRTARRTAPRRPLRTVGVARPHRKRKRRSFLRSLGRAQTSVRRGGRSPCGRWQIAIRRQRLLRSAGPTWPRAMLRPYHAVNRRKQIEHRVAFHRSKRDGQLTEVRQILWTIIVFVQTERQARR